MDEIYLGIHSYSMFETIFGYSSKRPVQAVSATVDLKHMYNTTRNTDCSVLLLTIDFSVDLIQNLQQHGY